MKSTLRIWLMLAALFGGICFTSFVSAAHADIVSMDVGPLETVLTRDQLRLVGLDYWPDGTLGILRNGSSYSFWAADSTLIGKTSGTLDNPIANSGCFKTSECGVVSVIKPKGNYNYYGGGPVYKDPSTGTLLMFA